MTVKIAINGLGRIGRSVLRALLESNKPGLEIIAANGPATIEDHAHLIKYDSVHGILKQNIHIEENSLIIDQHKIEIIREKIPENLPWKKVGVDIVLECSGKFNKKIEAEKHIIAGAKKVIVSAPCEDADNTIVFGANHEKLTKDQHVISVGSCTTNALAPLAKLLNDNIGIESGFMTTIHAYTNDQNLLDNSHKDVRRARAAALSMIPTSTGAARSIGLVLPELAGKLDGSSIRVPTPNVSMIDLSFIAKRNTSVGEINTLILTSAKQELKNIVDIAPTKLVSIDFNHNPHSSIFDPYETKVVGDKLVRIVSWYDNEWGFSMRMLDAAMLISKFI
ncbi:Glyceraldehyde-3-phosphate dehydrogenase [Rickettsiales bacterium Ac37b]|nr:Glyceraldehyde-3-phosphate dehydrogenase [Rickettsiales bacterium Ac37b]